MGVGSGGSLSSLRRAESRLVVSGAEVSLRRMSETEIVVNVLSPTARDFVYAYYITNRCVEIKQAYSSKKVQSHLLARPQSILYPVLSYTPIRNVSTRYWWCKIE